MLCDSCKTKKAYKNFRKLKKFLMFYKTGDWNNCCLECQRKWLADFGLPVKKDGEDIFRLVFD
jgi:hypothetical protein